MEETFNDLFDHFKKIQNDSSINLEEFIPAIPKDITTFLGQLSLLKAVPYEYLVPNEGYLPKYHKGNTSNSEPSTPSEEINSLKFFWIDPFWVQCLLNGAVSMLDMDAMDVLLNKAMAGNYASEVLQQELKDHLKKQLFGSYKPDDLEKEILNRMNLKGFDVQTSQPTQPTNAQSNWRYTGFLLRSSLVSGWKGLEIEAVGIDKPEDSIERPLIVVRMESIAPDTFFCLCEGIITKVIIKQPQESLHFGVEGDYAANEFKIQLNNEKVDNKIDVPLRGDGSRRVINIGKEIGLIKEKLNLNGGKFTSAEFAEEMIDLPIKNEISIKWVAG